MEAPKPLFQILLLFLLVSSYPNAFIRRALAEGVTPEEARQLRDEVTPVESLSFPSRNEIWVFFSCGSIRPLPLVECHQCFAVSLVIDRTVGMQTSCLVV